MGMNDLEYLRNEYMHMSLEDLDEMISYGAGQYEPQVFALIKDVAAIKRNSQELSDASTQEPVSQEEAIVEYIPLIQIQNDQEGQECSDILEKNDIDYYVEPFHAGIVRDSDAHSFLLVSHNDYDKAVELLLEIVPDSTVRD